MSSPPPHRSPFPDVELPSGTLGDVVFRSAAAHLDRTALVDGVTGQQLTYGTLLERIRRVAAGLAQRGIGKGSVVGLWAPNLPDYAVVLHSVARLGGTVTTANPLYTPEELSTQLNDAGARMLITTAAQAERARLDVSALTLPLDIVTIDACEGLPSLDSIAIDADPPLVEIDPSCDVVVLPYSSGTTGLPKGVMLTHRNLTANLAQLDAMESSEVKALLGFLPFFHIYGMVIILNFGLMRGATVVTLQRFDFDTVLRVLQEWPIGIAHVVPPVALAFAKHPSVEGRTFPSLTCLFSGAAPLGAELTNAIESRLQVRVRQGYGMTETSPLAYYTAPGWERAGKVGVLGPNTECRIVDPERGQDVGTGERGEVWLRGPQVMKGYLNNPEATAHTIDEDGWLHTGDIGVVDGDGYLEVVDRLKELIKVKGFQVAPAELEALLLSHPGIADAAVIPVIDAECGEVPKAVVVSRQPLTADDVMQFVEARVAPYKRVRHVDFVDQIPKSPSGKILRRVLVARERAID